MADVTIAGAGPVGLWTAGELARRGLDVIVIEKLDRPTPYSKALTIHPRTIEVLAQRGLADEVLAEAIKIPTGHFANLRNRMDFSVLDTPYPYTLLYSQEDTEILLERTARELGADIRRRQEVLSVSEEGDRVVTKVLADGGEHTIESRFLVGADGPRSTIRRALASSSKAPGRRAGDSWATCASTSPRTPPSSPRTASSAGSWWSRCRRVSCTGSSAGRRA